MKYFIYFSETGNGDLIAEKLKEQGFEIVKVEMKRKLAKSFFFKVMQGGFLASIHAKSKINDIDLNLNLEDKVVIGSPVWNARLSSPINTILKKYEFVNPSFLLYSGSGEAKSAVKYIDKNFHESKVLILKEPKKYPEELEKLSELIKR
ncbi:MAG: hypothetical protein J6W64_11445 [Bacilli bacterium]|nr:hypothetical protein [Bacilli bacterium]